jgi:hypothetical protein
VSPSANPGSEAHYLDFTRAQTRSMEPARSFSPFAGSQGHSCRPCAASIGTADGWHLWCARHRIVAVSPRGLWEREPGADDLPTAEGLLPLGPDN